MNQIPNIEEEFANKLSSSIRYSAGKGQYEAFPDCQDAYLDGVETAIAMMYIDLTGTPKTKGMLTKFLHHQLQKVRDEEKERIIKLIDWRGKGFHSGSEVVAWIDEQLKTLYHSELDQAELEGGLENDK